MPALLELVEPVSIESLLHICRGPANLAPWVYCIPADLAPFQELLAQLGVRESFSAEQYVGIMADMAVALHRERLSAEQQEQAIAVLQVTLMLTHDREGSLFCSFVP